MALCYIVSTMLKDTREKRHSEERWFSLFGWICTQFMYKWTISRTLGFIAEQHSNIFSMLIASLEPSSSKRTTIAVALCCNCENARNVNARTLYVSSTNKYIEDYRTVPFLPFYTSISSGEGMAKKLSSKNQLRNQYLSRGRIFIAENTFQRQVSKVPSPL